MTKKHTAILSLFASLFIVILLVVCGTAPQGPRAAAVVEHASAFIDFSKITGVTTLDSHQPEEDSEYIKGPFTLDNGITGDGLRVSNRGDSNDVDVVRYNGETAVQTQKGDYLYFFIDNDIIRRTGVVTIEFTFFDDLSGSFNFQYVRQGHNFYPIAIQKSGTNTFVTVKLELDACNFTHGHNQGAQFRFESGVIVQRVALVTGGMPDPLANPPPAFASATDLNNMIGKGVTGYQAWFKASGNWHHWSNNSVRPAPGGLNVEIYPAGWEDYLANGVVLHDTGFTMPDGSVGKLFNSQDAAVIRTHLKWMKDAGLDGAAVQRFFGNSSPVDTGDSPNHLTYIRDAAQEHGRIFYIMYDMSGAGRQDNPDQKSVVRRIQFDWIYNVENKGLVSSPNYAQAEGKPVVCIWGVEDVESTDNSRYISVDASIELIQWFRGRGYYVIGGIPSNTFWQQASNSHKRGLEMYSLFDMISPWYIGRDVTGQILSGGQWLTKGLDFCRNNPRKWAGNRPIDFMPTVWPGFAWTNMPGNPGAPNATPRNAGQWAWTQIQGYLNYDKNNVIQSFYFAMLDEYDEATAWMKAGVDFFDIPLEQYALTLSADGMWLSSDYYLRLARASVQSLQAKIAAGGGSGTSGAAGYTGPLNEYDNSRSVIVEHSLGPVFWRNSFERRNGRSKLETGRSLPMNHLQIDVGVPDGGVIGAPQNIAVTGEFTVNRPALRIARADRYAPPSETLGMIYTANAKSGGSVFRLAGERTAGRGASYLYKIAETRIKVNSAMSLSFWQRAENSLGANVVVDLLLDDGAYLSGVAGYNLRNDGMPQNGWQKKTVVLPAALNGRYITAVIIAYKDDGTAGGSFAALVDDIVIGN